MDESTLTATAKVTPTSQPSQDNTSTPSTSTQTTISDTSTTTGADTSLNPCSKDFNPELALRAPFIPGLPDVAPFPSLKQFESYHSDPDAYKRKEEESQIKRNLKTAAKSQEAAEKNYTLVHRPHKMTNVMTRMASTKGPLSKLRNWMLAQIRVKVVVRSFKGVRGSCTGFVAAFDRYLNLAMTDVDEVYSSLYRPEGHVNRKRGSAKPSETQHSQPASVEPEVELLSKRIACLKVNPCDNVKRRHVNQLFIRGDQIVMIYAHSGKLPS